MSLNAINIHKFMSHERTQFSFGKRVNIITGPNGSGKSTILEALMWCIWGVRHRLETDDEAYVELSFGQQRSISRKSGKTQQIVLNGKSTVGKQRADIDIEPVFGSYNAWARALYLNSKQVAAFSSGTPKTKIAHLEYIAGVQRINKAYEIASETRRQITADCDLLSRQISYADSERVKDCRSQIEAASVRAKRARALAEHSKVEDLECDLAAEKKKYDEQILEVEALSALYEEYGRAYQKLKNLHDALSAEEAAVKSKPVPCPVCKHPMLQPEAHAIAERRKVLTVELNEAMQCNSITHSAVYGARARAQTAELLIRQLEARIVPAKMADEAYAQAQQQLYELFFKLLDAHKQLAATRALLAKASERQQLYEIVTKVLHPTSVRSVFLKQYTQHIEAAANRYLSSMGASYTIGVVIDDNDVQVVVDGLNKPEMSKASSGEQRRIDISLMLAMAEIGANTGTVPRDAFFVIDEAFDTLDTVGVEALVGLALEISKTRQVFLVSHASPSLPAHPDIATIQLQ